MNTRLQPLNLLDFTGGLNLRRTDFQLADNESPAMLNVNMDPRGGIVSRAGWSAWNAANIIADPVSAWRPRNAEMHLYANGSFAVFVANGDKVYAGTQGQPFVQLAPTVTAVPHLADFAGWGDTMYIACGRAQQAAKVIGLPAVGNLGTLLAKAGAANFNDNYAVANNGVMPAAEHLEPHGGYMFAANLVEDGVTHPSRLRWSHPDQPEDWARDDYIDVSQGGSKITAIRSFRDHLLIFKVDSVWALYGYERDSWQLIKVSLSIGTPSPQAVTRSESAIYFYSASGRNGIYAYQGDSPVLISDPLRRATDAITADTDVWLGWISRRLWCSLPYDNDPYANSHGSVFVFDPELSESGSWIRYKPARGTIACIVERSDVATEYPMVVTCGCTEFAGVLRVMVAPDRAGDLFTAGEGVVGFRSYYRTNWKHAGWPDLQKSWLRPRVIARIPIEPVAIRLNTFWNYDPNNAQRTHVFSVDTAGGVFWRALGAADPKGGGFDWGDGTNWRSGARLGDVMVRPTTANQARGGGSLGWARAVMLEFSPEDYTQAIAWAVDAIILKYNSRRFTT